ncbi:MAG: hypothetical protein ACFFER_10400 [Candidatus Thorarchaeota archaeon]
MSDNSDLPRLYIVVETPQVPRCKWCGIGLSGGVPFYDTYCSAECSTSDEGGNLIGIIGGLLLLVLIPLLFLDPAFLILIAFVGMVVLGLTAQIRKTREKAPPKGSRANEWPSEISLLRSRLPLVNCPKCNENLNLSIIGEDKVFYCQYCDAIGVLEIKFIEPNNKVLVR